MKLTLNLQKTTSGEEDLPLRKLLDEIGNAPPQLPRKDNANVDLELDKTAKRTEAEGTDQIYAESKYLLFLVMKSIPSNNNPENITIETILDQAVKLSRQHSNPHLLENVNRIRENCKVLVQKGVLSLDDDYALLRKDAAEVFFFDFFLQHCSTVGKLNHS